jgi:hypothetical protein
LAQTKELKILKVEISIIAREKTKNLVLRKKVDGN